MASVSKALLWLALYAAGSGAQECASRWGAVEVPAADPILGIKAQFLEDEEEDKINLSVGAYRDDDGKPWVLPPVKAARERLAGPNATTEHEYLSIDGFGAYNAHAQSLLYGPAEADHHVVTVQALSGTGAVRPRAPRAPAATTRVTAPTTRDRDRKARDVDSTPKSS